jgi:hypothetical protein
MPLAPLHRVNGRREPKLLHFLSTSNDIMDDHHPQSANTAQRLAHRHPINVRQPVSCEPCRHRKIKCSRTRPYCETCRRRGCVDRCVYKGSRDSEPSMSGSSSNGNDELLSRISNLEKLLRKHTGTDIPNGNGVASSMLSPPTEFGQNSHLSPESLLSELSSHTYSSNCPSSQRVGVLTSTINGNVRYEPKSSRWTSVLANTNLSLNTPSMEDSDEASSTFGFPFTTLATSSVDALLALLPPVQQCDYLKDRYFTVFSPVSPPLFRCCGADNNNPALPYSPRPNVSPKLCSVYGSSFVRPSVLFVLLSLAVTGLEEDDPLLRDLGRGQDACSNIRVLSRRYREAAMKCLAKQGVLWGRHNVQSLQALIMLIYAMGHSQEPTWVLLGTYFLVFSYSGTYC